MTLELIQDRPLACEAFREADVGSGLRTVRLAPWGVVKSANGEFIIDEAGTTELIASFTKTQESVPVDVEHETLPEHRPPMGARGAIGWLERVFAEPGRGLFGMVEWNPEGRALIRQDRFRYLSPVFWIRAKDRRVVALHSAAITTKPAIPGMERLAASAGATEIPTMDGKDVVLLECGKLLGLSDTGLTLTACRAALVKRLDLSKRDSEVAGAVRERLSLSADAGRDEVIVALSLTVEGNASAELLAMKEAELEREAVELVQQYCQSNVLNKNDKAAYAAAMALAREQPDRLHALLANAKPLAPVGMTKPPPNGPRDQTIRRALTEFQSNAAHGKATSLGAFVNQALREAGQSTLSESETKELVTA